MIALLVVSDTHENALLLEDVLARQKSLPESVRPTHFVHLGDGIADIKKCKNADSFCIHAVRGNCDSFFNSLAEGIDACKVIELYGYRIAICHGNTFAVKEGDENVIEYAASQNADLLMFGHTHIASSYTVQKGTKVKDKILTKDLMVFNPGSLKYGKSFGVVTLSESGIDISIGKI